MSYYIINIINLCFIILMLIYLWLNNLDYLFLILEYYFYFYTFPDCSFLLSLNF